MVPLVHTIPEACFGAKIGRTALYEAIRSGALRAVKRGRRTLILDEDLRQWVHSLPPLQANEAVNVHNRDRGVGNCREKNGCRSAAPSTTFRSVSGE